MSAPRRPDDALTACLKIGWLRALHATSQITQAQLQELIAHYAAMQNKIGDT